MPSARGSLQAIFKASIGSPPSDSKKTHLPGRFMGVPFATGSLQSIFTASIGSPPSTLIPAPPLRGEQDAPALSSLSFPPPTLRPELAPIRPALAALGAHLGRRGHLTP